MPLKVTDYFDPSRSYVRVSDSKPFGTNKVNKRTRRREKYSSHTGPIERVGSSSGSLFFCVLEGYQFRLNLIEWKPIERMRLH